MKDRCAPDFVAAKGPTLLTALERQVELRGSKVAFCLLPDGETETDSTTFAGLWARSGALAGALASRFPPGARLLLQLPTGIDFIATFLACLRSGLLPVPAPIVGARAAQTIVHMGRDCSASGVLTDSQHLPLVRHRLEEAHAGLDPILSVQALEGEAEGPDGARAPGQIAFLQYTSGSTTQPKGVVVTHDNLLSNMSAIQRVFRVNEDSVGVGWLPLFHDMGLIGQVLPVCYMGAFTALMPPSAFLQSPLRWLRAISRYGATVSGAPNFAYDLTVRAAASDPLEEVRLGSWDIAFNGAEPVKGTTLDTFAARFAANGFRKSSFLPLYGLAESTLLATSRSGPPGVLAVHAETAALERDEVRLGPCTAESTRALIRCGLVAPDDHVTIVNPQTLERLSQPAVGEIWLGGPSVAAGYWNNESATAETFRCRTGNDTRSYLRTGDLGFVHEGGLYIVGRIKDVLVVRGKNHYPQDLEHTVLGVNDAFAGAAAFSISDDAQETRLAVVVELRRMAGARFTRSEAIAAVREAIADGHGLRVDEIEFVRQGVLPRTTSGKLRRADCRRAFLDGSLPRISEPRSTDQPAAAPRLDASSGAPPAPPPPETSEEANVPTESLQRSRARATNLVSWLREYAQRRLNSRLIDERRCIPPYVVLDFGNEGLLGLSNAQSYGGLQLTTEDALRVIEQLAAIDTTLAAFVGVHNALGGFPIEHHASPQIRERWLPAIVTGRALASFALTEPGAGSNPLAMASVGTPDPSGGFRLHGDKSWIGTGSWSSVLNVFVGLRDGEGNPAGITGFVVDQSMRGLEMGPEALTMGMRGMVQNSVHLRGVHVDEEAMLGRRGEGMLVAQEAINVGRLGLGAISVGAMKRCAQTMLRYAERRRIATGRLLENDLWAGRLETTVARTRAVEALTFGLARIRDVGAEVPPECYAACKVAGSESLWRASDDLMQMLGGRGYVETNLAPQLLRDARLLRIFEGPTETLLAYLGAAVLGPSRRIGDFITAKLDSPAVARELLASIAHARDLASKAAVPAQRLTVHLGEVVVAALLWAATEARAHSDRDMALAVPHASGSFEAAVRGLDQVAAPRTPIVQVAASIAAFAAQIGDVQQSLPGEDLELDPILRLNDPSSGLAPDRSLTAGSRPLGERDDRQAAAPGPTSDRGDPVRPGATRPRESAPMGGEEGRIQDWARRWLASKLHVDPTSIDPGTPVARLGLDSLMAVQFAVDLETAFEHPMTAADLLRYPTVSSLAKWLADSRIESPRRPRIEPDRPSPTPCGGIEVRPATTAAAPVDRSAPTPLDLSLLFFSSEASRTSSYNLVLDAAGFADRAGLEAVWLPERHFDKFGGLYPNPATVASALAVTTKRVRLRAGSVVLPLHDPLRVAEEWACVDVLSGGRVDLAFTRGWSPNDFVFYPERFAERTKHFRSSLEQVRQLWRGQPVERLDGNGKRTSVMAYPRPRQAELPVWVTCNRAADGFALAGTLGVNVLTALLSQSWEQLEENLSTYRTARERAGFDPTGGQISLMLHTFVGADLTSARDRVHQPLIAYLADALLLWQAGAERMRELSDGERRQALEYAFERYVGTSSLIGDVESCTKIAIRAAGMGIRELACLVDFGLGEREILDGLPRLLPVRDALRGTAQPGRERPAPSDAHTRSVSANAARSAPETAERVPLPRRPLSEAESSVWFMHRLAPHSPAYHQAALLRLDGPIEIDRALVALRAVLTGRTNLIARYRDDDDGRPFCEPQGGECSAGLEPPIDNRTLDEWVNEVLTAPFDLSSGKNMRARLRRGSGGETWLLFVTHHLAADGRSLEVLVDRWLALYALGPSDVPAVNADDAVQFAAHVLEEQRWLASPEGEAALSYWRETLSGPLPLLSLPIDRPHPATPSLTGGYVKRTLPATLSLAVQGLARAKGVTTTRLLLAAYSLWLHRVSCQDTVIIGVPTAGRATADVASTVGNFANPVPLRTDYGPAISFCTWLEQVNKEFSDAIAHARCPVSKIAAVVCPARTPGRTPLFQTLFAHRETLRDQDAARFNLPGITIHDEQVPQQAGQCELALESLYDGADLHLCLKFAHDILDQTTAEGMLDGFCRLLASVIESPEQPLALHPVVPEHMLVSLEGPRSEWPRQCVHELVNAQARRTPHAIAILDGDASLTYEELSRRVGDAARALRLEGVGPGTVVALVQPRCLSAVVSILAIWSCGAAYVPVDLTTAAPRQAFVVNDAGALIALFRNVQEKEAAQHLTCRCLCLDELQDSERIGAPAPSDDTALAYLMYTSGSTGSPKGVEVEHRSVVNFLYSMQRAPGLGPDDALLAVTGLTFDISLLELFLPLTVGARLVLASDEAAHDPPALIRQLERDAITVMQATPATWRLLTASDWHPSGPFKVLCGGDVMTAGLARALLRRTPDVWNLYGPTETTIWSTCHRVRVAEDSGVIGTPIHNTRVHLLDERGHPVFPGSIGELVLAGDGLARGYHDRPELQAAAFVEAPAIGEARVYRTGDFARLNRDGFCEFLGRRDQQVKILGHRVELGEIEAHLAAIPEVREAVVVAVDGAGEEKRLVAHLVAREGASIDAVSLRARLRSLVPLPLVPGAFVVHAQLPLTAHGKIDRKALSLLARSARPTLAGTGRSPTTPLEHTLCALWREVLKVDTVGLDDNFFALGGDSFRAAMLASRASAELQRPVRLSSLFLGQTVADMARVLEQGPSVDWRLELALADRVQTTSREPGTKPRGRRVLLTGATGLLGRHVLHRLLRDDDTEVVCLVRAADDDAARSRLARSLVEPGDAEKKLVSRCGDLGRDRLGLAETVWADLAGSVDHIVHCGAWIDFSLPYPVLKDANVLGTLRLIELAAHATHKHLTFASSLTVLGEQRCDGTLPDETDRARNIDELPTGYAQSKAVAEALLYRARDRGLGVSVVRMGVISGATDTGEWSQDQWLPRVLYESSKMGIVPVELLETEFRLTPVDWAARVLAACVRDPVGLGRTLHLEGKPCTLADLIGARPGQRLAAVPYERWRASLLDSARAADDRRLQMLATFFPEHASERLSLLPRVSTGQTDELVRLIDHGPPGLGPDVLARYWSWIGC